MGKVFFLLYAPDLRINTRHEITGPGKGHIRKTCQQKHPGRTLKKKCGRNFSDRLSRHMEKTQAAYRKESGTGQGVSFYRKE